MHPIIPKWTFLAHNKNIQMAVNIKYKKKTSIIRKNVHSECILKHLDQTEMKIQTELLAGWVISVVLGT